MDGSALDNRMVGLFISFVVLVIPYCPALFPKRDNRLFQGFHGFMILKRHPVLELLWYAAVMEKVIPGQKRTYEIIGI